MPRTNFWISYANKINYAKTYHPEMYETMRGLSFLHSLAEREYWESGYKKEFYIKTLTTQRKHFLLWDCIFENYKKRMSEIKALAGNKNKLPDFKYEIDDLVYVFLDPKKTPHVIRSRCKGELANIYNIYCPSDGIDINMEENTIGLLETEPVDHIENLRNELIPEWK